MAQQIKKKYIQDDAIDGDKIKLLKDQSVKGEDQTGQVIDLLKLDQDDKVLLKGEEAALKSQVDIEQQRAEGEETRIEGKVDTEKSRAEDAEAVLQSNIDTEQDARIAGDEDLQSKLDVEIVRARSAEEDLQSSIDAEKSRAEGEEAAIRSEFATADESVKSELKGDVEVMDTMGKLEDAINAEQVRAEGEELRIDGKLDTEISDRESEITRVEGLISAEEQARVDGDSDLDAKIQTEKERIDAILYASEADKDSFKEIVALINDVDTENDEAFAGYVLSNNARSTQIETSVSQEILDRTTADDQLQDNIEAEEAARITGDQNLQSSLNSEQAARISQDGILQDNIDAEQTRAEAAESQLQSNIEQEVSDRQDAVSAEQSRAEGQEAAIRSEFAAADSTLQSTLQANIDAEEQSRIDGDNALDGRLSPIEGMLEYKHSTVHDNNAAVYADAQKGKEDANLREGWYYTNEVAGQKINWYFHDGQKDIVSLKDFSAYAVMTFDDASESPILGVYTFPTGSNDAASWYHSRVVYSGLSSTPEVGKKYVVYFGQNPEIHPELPRLELSKESSPFTIGEQLDDEIVMTSSFGTDSSAGVGNVKFMVESLGVHSPSHKTNVKLKIHHATQEEFDALQSQVDALDGNFATDQELSDAVSSLQAEIDADVLVEKERAEAAEQSLFNGFNGALDQVREDITTLRNDYEYDDDILNDKITDEVIARQDLEGEFDAYVVSNDQALADEIFARVSLEGEFDGYVVSNDQALAQEVSDRQAADSTLQSNIDQEVSDRQAADSTLQSNIDIEKGRIDAILYASEADKDSFAEIVALINDVDTENDSAFAGYVLSNNARVDTLESEMNSVEANLAQELLDRAAGDQNLQDQIDEIQSGLVQFGKESIEVTSQMITDRHIDLQVEIKPNSMVMFVDRLGMHEGLDYSVSTVGGVSRITFLSPMLQPSEEALEVGQFIRVTYGK